MITQSKSILEFHCRKLKVKVIERNAWKGLRYMANFITTYYNYSSITLQIACFSYRLRKVQAQMPRNEARFESCLVEISFLSFAAKQYTS